MAITLIALLVVQQKQYNIYVLVQTKYICIHYMYTLTRMRLYLQSMRYCTFECSVKIRLVGDQRRTREHRHIRGFTLGTRSPLCCGV